MMNEKTRSKVLIVDDSPTNTFALKHILEPSYDIISASDGVKAIDAAENDAPDIILLDILMPGISGLDVLQKLKESETTKYIPVIFITGLDNIEDEERGLLLGAVDYITKPFHNAVVKARVKTHLRLSGYTRTIERLCMIDTLTELPNRRGFDSRMKAEWENAVRGGTPLSVLIIDIDRFKDCNDAYGHAQGDSLLQTVADIFLKSLNSPTDFVARWGGDEFVMLLPHTPPDSALHIAEEIRKTVEETTISFDDGVSTSVTISIGMSTITPHQGDSMTDFFASADRALYNAKNSGKNQTSLE